MILGIDTSAYTTSLALVDQKGTLIKDMRRLLEVPARQRGLQQAAAVFQHVQNLPPMVEEAAREVNWSQVELVMASTRPRPVDGSYMPVFTVGAGQARVIAGVLGIPFGPVSHQEGHLMAGLWSAGAGLPERFLAVHLSGGTTEILKVERTENGAAFFDMEILGGTTDLHAGQFVDRVGVAMGINFPAGPELDKLALLGRASRLRIPSAVQGLKISFSGPETYAQRLLQEGAAREEVAFAVLHCIALSLEKTLIRAVAETSLKTILLVGGVAANSYLRERLSDTLSAKAVGAEVYFAQPRYSTDNAAGVALLGSNYLLPDSLF